ncbi:MAG: T9SS type A sorting domain-containing protein [Syntrophothermus sp.]
MKLFIMFFVLTISNLFSQQFPIGIYINTHGPQDRLSNYPQIDSIGFNYIIEETRGIRDYINNIDFNIIPCNSMDSLDFVHQYTKGMLKTWQAEDTVKPNKVGFKSPDGIGIVSGNYIESLEPEEYKEPKYLLTGPDYHQYSHYGGGYKGNDTIFYLLEFRMKIANEHIEHLPVCSLEVVYANGSTLTLLADTTIYTDELATEYNDIYINYFYPFSTSNPLEKGFQKGISTGTSKGVKFNIIWLGNEKLYVDYARIYDDLYGNRFINYSDSVRNDIYEEISDYNYANIKYLYSFDEPHSLDNYEPYRIVDSIVQSIYQDKSIITAMYPEWNGYRDSCYTMQRFQQDVNPEKIMYYYYPFGYDKDGFEIPSYNAFNNQINLFIRNHSNPVDKMQGSFWFVGQSCSFYEAGGGYNLRRVSSKEMLSSTMLALANGANGIFYWQYYTDFYNGSYRIKGIVDKHDGSWYPHTDLYGMLKDTIVPRLKGVLGDNLLKSKYDGKYVWINDDIDIRTAEYLTINQTDNQYHFYGGLLKDTVDGIEEFLITNLKVNSVKELEIVINKPNRNFRAVNVEGGLDVNIYGQTTFYDNFLPGDGHLFRLLPSIKYGGTILGNETISNSETLLNNLEITSNKELTIDDYYYLDDTLKINSTNNINLNINGYIIIEDEGGITVNTYGPLAKLKTTDNHPWLIWGEYTLTSPIYYKIFRSYGGGAWQLFDTTSQLNYVDTTVTIQTTPGMLGLASYYICASKESKPLSVKSDTVTYRIYGSMEKEGNEAALRYENNLEQNYPNPFNPQTTISYELKEDCFVSIKIYDLLGNQVKELVSENKPKGRYAINLAINNLNISSGIYFYTINAGKYINTKKMVILK